MSLCVASQRKVFYFLRGAVGHRALPFAAKARKKGRLLGFARVCSHYGGKVFLRGKGRKGPNFQGVTVLNGYMVTSERRGGTPRPTPPVARVIGHFRPFTFGFLAYFGHYDAVGTNDRSGQTGQGRVVGIGGADHRREKLVSARHGRCAGKERR